MGLPSLQLLRPTCDEDRLMAKLQLHSHRWADIALTPLKSIYQVVVSWFCVLPGPMNRPGSWLHVRFAGAALCGSPPAVEAAARCDSRGSANLISEEKV